MSDQFWLTKAQLKRIESHFPKSRGVPRADDRRVVSGIIHVIRNGLRWRDAPADYGPHKTLYNRFVRWSRMGIFHRILACLAAEGVRPDLLMIDSTHLKVHRTAASQRLLSELPMFNTLVQTHLEAICAEQLDRETLRPLGVRQGVVNSARRLIAHTGKYMRVGI